MNKSDLIKAISDSSNLSKTQSNEAVNAFISVVSKALDKGPVRLVKFGKFYKVWRKAHPGHNPATGEPIKIPGAYQVKFKPGKQLKKSANIRPRKKAAANRRSQKTAKKRRSQKASPGKGKGGKSVRLR